MEQRQPFKLYEVRHWYAGDEVFVVQARTEAEALEVAATHSSPERFANDGGIDVQLVGDE